jgi:DNA-binding transcriptional ArsR family regulator
VNDPLGAVFFALADPTRRRMVESLLDDGTTTVPALTDRLPITRQAVAQHLATLQDAGLVERLPAGGREVRDRLREGALHPTAAWLRATERAWDDRLARLKRSVEPGGAAAPECATRTTSPAPSSRSPASVRTRRRPSSSVPSATPVTSPSGRLTAMDRPARASRVANAARAASGPSAIQAQ